MTHWQIILHILFTIQLCVCACARVHALRTQADTSLIALHWRYLVLELTRKSEVSSRFPPSAYLRFIEKTIQPNQYLLEI